MSDTLALVRLRIGAAQVNTTVGDLDGNAALIAETARAAGAAGCDVVCFPELALTGYPPEDLLHKPAFVADVEAALADLAAAAPDVVMVVGTVVHRRDLYNAAAVIAGGSVAGVYRKEHLPNYGVFDEKRYFASSPDPGPLFRLRGVTFGITICEDVWMPAGPILAQARAGAQLAINVNASPYHIGKHRRRREMLATRASDVGLPLVFVNLVGGQDELVFDGGSALFDVDGEVVDELDRFETALGVWDVDCSEAFRRRLVDTRPRSWGPLDLRVVDLDAVVPARPGPPRTPAVVTGTSELQRCDEVYRALRLGVHDYLDKNGFRSAVVGLSGGIDSALTTVIAVDAIGAGAVTGIAMPSPYSSEHSVADARLLAERLGIRFELLPISAVFRSYLDTLDPLFAGTEHGVAEENLQARIRGTLLMAFSNKFGSILLSTGNKSEMAVGYSTLYGDLAGGYAVLKDVPKTLVYELSRWRNEVAGTDLVPESTISKPPSAELRPDQLDSDSLPPYDVLDRVIEAYVERDRSPAEIVESGVADQALVDRVVRMIDAAEYKRRQAPPGVRITPKAFGRDRRLPITNGRHR
ncbi:MAG: NAD+ synthase [Acidimicrobiia bacterium]|nr:NAD+ synthase [Acidimicrobiia bacterium]